jgi:iron(III) transport system ATP-binding protein
MLTLNSISLSYDKKVLDALSFTLKQGEVIGIVGHSGVGKTSLLKIISGLQDASSGEVYLEGKRVVGPSMRLIPGHNEIQLVNQDFALDSYQTVEENVRGKILHLPTKTQNQFIDELLDLVEMTHLRTHFAHTLSGGEQQRLAIIRALAMEPKVLLLDEPFVHLDVQLRYRLISYLLELKEVRNMGVIIVSHNNEELLSLSDRIVYIKDGKVKRIASPLDFYYRYKTLEEGRMFGIVNRINNEGKMLSFRPDEYEIVTNDKSGIEVVFSRAIFMGSFFLNEFKYNQTTIVLYNKSELTNVGRINIKK